jgi:hypothetical protein
MVRSVRVPDSAIARLAEDVVRALTKPGFIKAKVPERQLAERVARLLVETMHAEQDLEEEAEKLAAKLGRQALGMDQRKLIEGIKARLAKERNFPL